MGGKGSGRKTKPLEQHLAEGTYNVTRHRFLDAAKRGSGSAPLKKEPPDYLDAYAEAVWEQLFPEVTAGGLVTEAERELFAAYCIAVGTLRLASEHLAGGPVVDVVKAGKGDAPPVTVKGISPYHELRRQAMADMATLGRQLGLTSVDRGKVLKAKPQGSDKTAGGLPKSRPKTALDIGGPLRIAATFDAEE